MLIFNYILQYWDVYSSLISKCWCSLCHINFQNTDVILAYVTGMITSSNVDYDVTRACKLILKSLCSEEKLKVALQKFLYEECEVWIYCFIYKYNHKIDIRFNFFIKLLPQNCYASFS